MKINLADVSLIIKKKQLFLSADKPISRRHIADIVPDYTKKLVGTLSLAHRSGNVTTTRHRFDITL